MKIEDLLSLSAIDVTDTFGGRTTLSKKEKKDLPKAQQSDKVTLKKCK